MADEAKTQDDEVVDLSAPGVVECSCEFCGKSYWIDANRYSVMHEQPACPSFEVMDVLTFMEENRRIKERRAKNRPQA